MKKRMIAIAMAWVLLLQTVFGAGMLTASADSDVLLPEDAATVTDAAYGPVSLMAASKESILTKVKLLDQNNTVIDAVYNPSREGVSKPGDPVRIEYEWSLENGHGYKAGDKFEFDIPKEFTVYSKFTEQLNTDNGSIGEFTVEPNGHVTVVFNELVDNSEVRGTMEISTEFSKTTIKGSVEVPITFPIRGGDQVAKVKFAPFGGKPLTKQGTASGEKYIDWTLDVNTDSKKLNTPEVSDKIPDGLELDETSIKVYQLNLNIDKAPDVGGEVTPEVGNYTVTADGSAFSIKFNDAAFTSAYRIQFRTNVIDEKETYFNNTATLKSDSTSENASDDVTIQRKELVTKKAGNYDPVNQTVEWTIEYNHGEKDILKKEAVVEDRFPDTMDLVGGIMVTQLGGGVVDSSKYVVADPEDLAPDQKGFTLKFNQDINSGYTIKYKTKYNPRVYSNVTVSNEVYSTYKGEETKKSASQTFKSGIGTKSLVGSATNYATKELTWRIVVNSDLQKMTNLEIKDNFTGGGLTFIPSELEVTSKSGNVIPYNLDSTIAVENGFKLNFTGDFTEEYVITYKTTFDPSKSLFGNEAALEWAEKTADYQTLKASFNPNNETKNNGAKIGSYDPRTKKITWTIYANYNGFDVENAVFEDVLQENQTLVENSLKVYNMSVQKNGDPLQGSEIDLSSKKVDTTNGKIEIEFGNISEPYWITFQTTLDNTLIADKIPNVATLSSNGTVKGNWGYTVTVPHGEVYVSKTGVRGVDKDADKINWQIKINEGQSYVENAKIVDTPSANQIVKPETFELYEGIVGSNGDVSTGKLLEKDKDYEVVLHTDDSGELKSFEVILPKTIETAYILKYQSEIAVSVDKEKITNQVSFIGDGVSVGTRETEQAIEIRLSSGSGTGSGVRGGLEVTKVDKDSPGTVLPGAKFELKNSKGESIGVKETGADGKITFTKLLYDTYTLTELQAPAGYKAVASPLTVKIDKEVQSTGGVKVLPVPNEKIPYIPLGGLEILKVAKEDNSKVLPGAKFQLQDAGLQKDPVVLTTDKDGIARINGLIFGDYILKEIEAPAGYILDSTERKVTIDKESVVKMTLVNEKQPDPVVQLEVVKVDKDDASKKLAGATFVLQDAEKRREPVTVTTGTYGVALFPNLLYGEYILKETVAPAGYVLDAAERPVTIGATTELVDGKFILPISNTKMPQIPGNPGNSGGGNGSSGGGNSGSTGGSSQPQNPTQPSKPNDSSTPPAKDGDGGNNNDQGNTVIPGTGNGSAGDTTGPVQTPGQDTEQDGKNNSLRDSGDETGDDAGKKGRGVKVLPKTGEDSALPIQLAGVSLIALGLLLKRRMTLKK
ncbi:LPXTG cell wall anchor domain-containing protein [Paenibacillus sp. alder61]|uniref:LPXTG cell wall anchor domain-containing protein n=1 Tax=Paenibacillus sp. alder61 TaxID=2862948 RepID=UPI001CD32900|nr:LPXTG cell wall anchor domain-containing protein [Paenibacillus sp. alder61]MCA1294311.1 LPXTG cell wall anchor domain-containing protein [Paenibacillus sp. alder61]